nr:MAG TPA: hypothetical protein [Caudoviricetes sp.]
MRGLIIPCLSGSLFVLCLSASRPYSVYILQGSLNTHPKDLEKCRE